MTEQVRKMWPELDWIKDQLLREKTAKTWCHAKSVRALRNAPVTCL